MTDKTKHDHIGEYIEALIFASDSAMTLQDIQQTLSISFDQKFATTFIEDQLTDITTKYNDSQYVMQLTAIAGGYQFMTKPKYHKVIGDYLRQNEKKRLSKSALETLSIIAYKQPVIKSEMESIRGVNCDYTVQKLLEKELVEIKGRHEGPGRPLLYGTTVKFLDHFGIKEIKELPNLKEFETVENSIGEQSDIEQNGSSLN